MRKLMLFAALAAALAITGCKNKDGKGKIREYVVDDSTVVELGTINEADGPVEFVFLYKNNTPDTLVAQATRTTCGCTTPMLNNMKIPPGEYQRIPIKFTPAYKKGYLDEQVDVRYTDGSIRSFLFTVTVNPMLHPITDSCRYPLGEEFYSSHKVLSMGVMEAGDTKDIYFHYGNNRKEPISVRFELSGQYSEIVRMTRELMMNSEQRDTMHVKFTMPKDLAPGDSVRVTIQPYINDIATAETIKLEARRRDNQPR